MITSPPSQVQDLMFFQQLKLTLFIISDHRQIFFNISSSKLWCYLNIISAIKRWVARLKLKLKKNAPNILHVCLYRLSKVQCCCHIIFSSLTYKKQKKKMMFFNIIAVEDAAIYVVIRWELNITYKKSKWMLWFVDKFLL